MLKASDQKSQGNMGLNYWCWKTMRMWGWEEILQKRERKLPMNILKFVMAVSTVAQDIAKFVLWHERRIG